MRKSILLLFLLVLQLQVYSEVNLKEFTQEARNEYLLSLAKEVVLNFGPDYYRTENEPVIEGPVPYYFFGSAEKEKENWDDIYEPFKKISGREYYSITYFYDSDEEPIGRIVIKYCAEVRIWADNGEPFEVMFGTGWGVTFYPILYRDLLKYYEGRMEEIIVKYPKYNTIEHFDGTVDTIWFGPGTKKSQE
ncbi:MAG TPA: hypothetical protein VFC94_03205 [Bacteroidaceae bacterium]|nr:hypothetical protein [Bacteroidaceae bacterium]